MRAFVTAAVVGLAAVGCGGGGTGGTGPGMDPQEAVLKEVADLLRSPAKPAAKAADLAPFEGTYPRAFQAVKSGEVVVLWGTPMMGEGDAAKGGGVPVAYEKAAASAGGWVLLTSGQVKKMAAADIPAAKK